MANTIDIGNTTSLIIKIPARGETNWSQDFKDYFADEIADHDHTSGRGARIKNAALVTYTMVNEGAVFEDHNGNEIAYLETDVTVSTDTIQNSAVTTPKIADDAITGDKIADNSITTAHIAPDTVIAADIATNAITEDELRDDASDDSLRAVSTNHIKDANVTTAKIADSNVTTSKIADSNVTTAKIADSNVTTDKLANDAVTIDKIADSSVGYYQLVDGAIGTPKIASLSVTTDKLVNDAVTTIKIADANVTTAKIADANVTAAKIGSDVVLSTLNDVSSTTPSSGQFLSFDGSNWTPSYGTTHVITTPTEYSNIASSIQDGDTLVFKGTATSYTLSLGNVQGLTIINTVGNSLTFDGINGANLYGFRIISSHPNSEIHFSVSNLHKCNIICNDIYFDANVANSLFTTNITAMTMEKNCDVLNNSFGSILHLYNIINNTSSGRIDNYGSIYTYDLDFGGIASDFGEIRNRGKLDIAYADFSYGTLTVTNNIGTTVVTKSSGRNLSMLNNQVILNS